MKTGKYFFTLAAITVLMVPIAVSAGPVVRSGDAVTVGQDQMVEGDFYAAAGTVTVSGDIEGDAYIAAGSATVNAPVAGDMVVAGGAVQLHGSVADDIRVFGGEVTLASEVGGDVLVFGGTLRVLSTAKITGDILFWGGDLVLEGPVGGSVAGAARTARIDTSVGGDVNLRASDRFVLGDRAEVLGTLAYESSREMERAQNAVVVGEIQMQPIEHTGGASVQMFVLALLMTVFLALTSLLVAPRHIEAVVVGTKGAYGTQGILGLAVLVGLPFAAFILMISVLGFFAGVLLLAGFVALLIISLAVLCALVGSYAMKLIMKRHEVTVVSVGLGALLLHIVAHVPLLGPLAVFAGLLVALGGVASRAYRAIS